MSSYPRDEVDAVDMSERAASDEEDWVLQLIAERDLYRKALNCRGCGGEGFIESSRYVEGEFGFSGTVEPVWERCPECKEAREKARGG